MSRRHRIIVVAVGLLAAAWFLFSLEPPLFWGGLIFGLLWISGSAPSFSPSDNEPGPAWMTFTVIYGFQTIVFFALLIIGVVWVIAAPAPVAEEFE